MSDFSSSKQPMANIDSSGKIWYTPRRSRRYLFLIMFSFKVENAFRNNLLIFLVFLCRKFAARRSIHEIPKASEKVSLHLRLGNFAGSMHRRNISVLHRKPGKKTFLIFIDSIAASAQKTLSAQNSISGLGVKSILSSRKFLLGFSSIVADRHFPMTVVVVCASFCINPG